MKPQIAYLIAAAALTTPWVESKDFSRELQEKAYAATLQVKTETDDIGTAVRVYRADNGMTYYLTAAHVVGNATNVDLTQFDPKTGNASPKVNVDVKDKWPDDDLALLRGVEPVAAPSLRICPKEEIPKEVPFPVLSIGCQLGSPDIWLDKAKKEVSLNRHDGKGGIKKSLGWQVGLESRLGRSGGPLVSKNGYLVGICSGMTKEETYYVHIAEIHKCLGKVWPFVLVDAPPKSPEKGKN